MKKLLLLPLLLLLGMSTLTAGELKKLFPLKAEITTGPVAGLQRMPLPPDVLRRCRADLSDLRILDEQGREIPYLIDNPEPGQKALALRYSVRAKVLQTRRSRSAIDRQSTKILESYMLNIPPLPERAAAWNLTIKTLQREFVARVDVDRIVEGGRRIPLLDGESIFRLPSSNTSRLTLQLGDVPSGRIEIKLTGRDQPYLSPSFTLKASRILSKTVREGVKLEILEKRELPQKTELLLSRPRGLIPPKLFITTSTPTFRRNLSAWDEGPGARNSPLSKTEIFRIQAIAPVESLEIPLARPHGDRLRLTIENEGSPPLEDIGVRAILSSPVLVFSTRHDHEKLTLLFGGGRTRALPYDIQSPTPSVHGETPATDRLVALLDPNQASTSELGPIADNPDYDAAPALAFAAHPGAKLQRREFRYRRVLNFHPSAEGLVQIPLKPEDLQKLRPDLGDLRIADAQGFQWAFLRQDASCDLKIPLEIPTPKTRDGVSRYDISFTSIPLSPLRLRMQTKTPFFDRDLRCFGIGKDGGERVLFETRIIRKDGDPRPLDLTFPNRGLTQLRIEISDGDDAPLYFDSGSLQANGPRLFLPAVAGEYELLLGSPQTLPPRYEIERIRQTILALPSGKADCGPLEENPDYSATHRLLRGAKTQKTLLWGLLILTVLLLTALTLRSARRIPPERPPE